MSTWQQVLFRKGTVVLICITYNICVRNFESCLLPAERVIPVCIDKSFSISLNSKGYGLERNRDYQVHKEPKEGRSAMKIDLVIKFGGSSITDKDSYETLRPEALQAACKLIKSCTEKGKSCVIVHGAGSFGHHHAKKYKVNDGWSHLNDGDGVKAVKMGMCLTRQSVTKLHQQVVSALLSQEIPATGISAFGGWELDNRAVIRHNIHSVTSLLKAGFVPVLHGDVILDKTLGCVVLSGDTIIETICGECSVERVVFLTSVDGIYDKPPTDDPNAQLQHELLINREGDISSMHRLSTPQDIVSGSCSSGQDVTGGMTLKLKTAISISKKSAGKTSVHVCKVGSSYSTNICCKGHVDWGRDFGTVIKYIDT